MKSRLQATLAAVGYRVERISEEERQLAAGFDPRHAPSEQERHFLTADNPRLRELELLYASDPSPMAAKSLWTTDEVDADVRLQYFRGDNLYVWQYTRSPALNRLRMLLYAKALERVDGPKLLYKLKEDGAFGCFTFEAEGLPTFSRDLLDSVGELLFLDRQMQLLTQSGLRVLDIGAGYGRLAHRMLEAAQGVSKYYCTDAVSRSTFLCEFYLRHRGLTGRAEVLALPDVVGYFAPGDLDLAVNIHSFSEMPARAIQGWLDLLQSAAVPRLLIVPNDARGLFSREVDGSKIDCSRMLTDAGYDLRVVEPTIPDAGVRDVLDIQDQFFFYEMR